jgi:hypothetical protein
MRTHDQGWRDLQQEPLTPVKIAIAIVCAIVIGTYFVDLIARAV